MAVPLEATCAASPGARPPGARAAVPSLGMLGNAFHRRALDLLFVSLEARVLVGIGRGLVGVRLWFRLWGHRTLLSGVQDAAAVRMQYLPGHVGGVLARQEYITGRHFVGLAGALHRRARTMLGNFLGVERCRYQRCPDRTRRDGVDADALLHQRLRQ